MNSVEVKFKAMNKNVSLARNIASAFLLEYDPTISFLNEVKTIVSEGVTNAIVHGYQNDESKDVFFNLSISDELLKIEITDLGIGIQNIEQAKMPLFSTKSDQERSGLGFTIMEVFSDSLEVISNENLGTTLTCSKKIINE